MQIDIAQHIEQLLYNHDTLIVPGFGGFTSSKTPASVDYIGGVLTPPSKVLLLMRTLPLMMVYWCMTLRIRTILPQKKHEK